MIGIILALGIAYLLWQDYKNPNNSHLNKIKNQFREFSN